MRPLDPQERQQVETEGTLVVEQVTGPALAAGVQQGDIILGVNGKKVKTIADLQAAAKGRGQDGGAADPARRWRADLRAAASELIRRVPTALKRRPIHRPALSTGGVSFAGVARARSCILRRPANT